MLVFLITLFSYKFIFGYFVLFVIAPSFAVFHLDDESSEKKVVFI